MSDWAEAVFVLPVLSGQRFFIRWHFGSDGYLTFPGWYIDDISSVGISAPIQRINDVAVDSIMYPLSTVTLNVLQYPYALVKNWGILEQVNFPVVCSIVNTNGILRYSDTKFISLAESRDTFVYFTSWFPTTTEICTTKICTKLINDENSNNDRKTTASEIRWVLFDYGFEDPYFPPTGWVTYNNDGGTQSWIRGALSPHSGAGSAESRFESSTIRNDDWLVTQAINIPSNSAELRFWYHAHIVNNFETLQVKLSTTGNAINDFTTTLAEFRFNNTSYNEYVIPLNGYAGQDIYIAFINKGLYQRKIYLDDIMIKGFTIGINEQPLVNQLLKTMLYPMKPNPVSNGLARISFSIAEPSKVALKIYDASGRIVSNLVDEFMGSGVYSVVWNGKDEHNRKVAEGIYFYTFETSKQKFTKKMIFTR